MEAKKNSVVQPVLGAVVAIAAAWYFFGGGMEKQASNNLQGIYDKVALDAVDQYRIVKQNGQRTETCVQAGMVAAAYLQAKNEASYKQWKATERTDCGRQ